MSQELSSQNVMAAAALDGRTDGCEEKGPSSGDMGLFELLRLKKGGFLHLFRAGPSQQELPTWTTLMVGSLHFISFNAWAMVSCMCQLGQTLVPSHSNTHLGLLWSILWMWLTFAIS